MGGSCKKYGTRQFIWKGGKNVVWLFKLQEWPKHKRSKRFFKLKTSLKWYRECAASYCLNC
jgi:hypothetical protein